MATMDKIEQRGDTLAGIQPKSARHLAIEIGDAKQPDAFLPRAKIMAWNNEANLSIGLITDKSATNVVARDDIVEWSNSEYDARFYPLSLEQGGLEFEFTLRQKPTSNVIELSIETKGLEFFYQPPLSNQERLEKKVFRPKNVECSYAVYFKRESGLVLPNDIYRAGKAFHIYRPHAKDANGKGVWCDIHIDVSAKRLTITIPQAYLDTAVYPIWVDPTVGYTTIGASSSNSSNPCAAVVGVPENTLTSVTLALSQGLKGSEFTVNAAVFDQFTGFGASLVAQGTERLVTLGSTPQWVTFALSADPLPDPVNPPVLAWYASGFASFWFDTGGTEFTIWETYDAGFAATATVSGNLENRKVSAYATFSEAASEPPAQTAGILSLIT